jgi:hypothetical protein
MSKQRAVSLCGCLAALSLLIGCSGGVGPSQAYAPSAYGPSPAAQAYVPSQPYPAAEPAAAAAPGSAAQVYAVGPGAPAAILVMLPGPGDTFTANPQLWTAQGFDVVTPTPAELYRFAADQERAAAQLIAQAESLANAPVWLFGPSPTIEAAMASLPRDAGQVSGVVMTSTTSGAGTCSEEMTYSYAGNGAAPKVRIEKSGNACSPGSPIGSGTNSAIAPAAPPAHRAPRVIEASVPLSAGSPASQRAAAQQIADAIKAARSG